MSANKSKAYGSIAIILILFILVVFKKCFFNKTSNEGGNSSITLSENEIRNQLMSHKLIFTAHAKCRMACRDITIGEVNDVLEQGSLNKEKSSTAGENCPTFAFEGKTNDNQKVRIIFGGCEKTTKVITCIDLEEEHNCNCK